MGMVLVLTTVSDATIRRLLEDPPLVWQVLAPDDPEAYARERGAAARRPLLARLLERLRGAAPPLPPPPAPLELGPGEGESADLDKAWHGLHFLLTGTAWEGAPPLALLVSGGAQVGAVEVGYGPARAFTAAETAAAQAALAALGDEELRRRYDPAEMSRLDVYPSIWARSLPDDDPPGYLLEHLATLREFLDRAAAGGLGLLVSLS